MLITLAELVTKKQHSKTTNKILNKHIDLILLTYRVGLYDLNTVETEYIMLNKYNRNR